MLLGEKVLHTLEEIIYNKNLMADLTDLSTRYHISKLEAFHSLLINLIPKSTYYSYKGMFCR